MLLDLDRRPQQTLAVFNEGHLKSAPTETTTPTKSSETASPAPPAAARAAAEAKITKPIGEYLDPMLGKWSPADAEAVLGHPTTHRFAYDTNKTVDGDIYAYDDPTRFARLIELNFDGKTNRLRAVYLYPSARITWEDCKKMYGDNVQKTRGADGTKFYAYRDRRVSVLLDKNDLVINFGLFPQIIANK